MPRKAARPQSRRHILIYDEDWNFLSQWFGISSPHPIGVGPAIRELVHNKVIYLRAVQERKIDQTPQTQDLMEPIA